MNGTELANWIAELERRDELWKFYKSKAWMKLKEEVLREQHNECQVCLEEGRLTKADTVHHVNEVRERPDLALSKYYIDEHNNKKLNLISICKRCHNRVHNRFTKNEGFSNVERW